MPESEYGLPDGCAQFVFLLGAGASVGADLPTTARMVSDLVKSREVQSDETAKGLISEIVSQLEEWKKTSGRRLDVEELLQAVDDLENPSARPWFAFIDSNNPHQLIQSTAKLVPRNRLSTVIRRAIYRICCAEGAQTEYLRPLNKFVFENRPYRSPTLIFTTNYDLVLESNFSEHGIKFTDGFGLYWEGSHEFLRRSPNNQIENEVLLFKLHGSVSWFVTDRGEYVKNPFKVTSEDSIGDDSTAGNEGVTVRLADGRVGRLFILYPHEKNDFPAPIVFMLDTFRRVLRDCQFLVVVGYSLRDRYILQSIWDAARANESLTTIVIDPSPWSVEDKLRWHDDKRTEPSPLNEPGRVVCWPFPFEKGLLKLFGPADQSGNDWRSYANYVHGFTNILQLHQTEKDPPWDKVQRTADDLLKIYHTRAVAWFVETYGENALGLSLYLRLRSLELCRLPPNSKEAIELAEAVCRKLVASVNPSRVVVQGDYVQVEFQAKSKAESLTSADAISLTEYLVKLGALMDAPIPPQVGLVIAVSLQVAGYLGELWPGQGGVPEKEYVEARREAIDLLQQEQWPQVQLGHYKLDPESPAEEQVKRKELLYTELEKLEWRRRFMDDRTLPGRSRGGGSTRD